MIHSRTFAHSIRYLFGLGCFTAVALLVSPCTWGQSFQPQVQKSLPAKGQDELKRSQFVSDASFIVATHRPEFGRHKPKQMAEAANLFLESLGKELAAKARYKIDSSERKNWTNLPARKGAGGVRFGELNEKQIRAACNLIACLMSKQGYQKMVNIMIADDQLLSGGRPRQGFGTEDFSLVVFGKPNEKDAWAFQLDGHHIGVNIAIQGNQLTMSPSFIGTQPEVYKINREISPLGKETKTAYRLLNSLNPKQLEKAIVSKRRGQLQTGPGQDGKIPGKTGVEGKALEDAQQKLLMSLIANWLNDLPEHHAKARIKSIQAEIDQIHFAWSGPKEFGGDFSFIIQGPSLIIEYSCQQNRGNPRDHLHTMYRNPKNEYGGQLKK